MVLSCGMSAIRTLLHESIDYAGLFPPAALGMSEAVANYARYRTGSDAWALGRFVVPVSRLGEFEEAAAQHFRQNASGQPWQLTLLAGTDLTADLEAIAEYNRRHSERHPSVIADALEVKATSNSAIEDTLRRVPAHLQTFLEIPIEPDPSAPLVSIARLGGRAKVRTGGVDQDAFPLTWQLLRFLRETVRLALPFKATAGLHHPLRAAYRLTYEEDSPTGVMFGYLNLFLAVAFLQSGMDHDNVVRVLEEGDAASLLADSRGISWRNQHLDLQALREVRRLGMISFGSCSFTEPLRDLERLDLLSPRVTQA